MEVIDGLENSRLYRKWSARTGSWVKSNHGDIVELANRFFQAQGILKPDEHFQGNAGRKCLAKWLLHLKIGYEPGFQIHGDLECVWSGHYEGKPRSGTKRSERTQSLEPAKCCEALQKLAQSLNRGVTKKKKMSRSEKLCLLVLQALGKEEEAEAILAEGSDEEE